MLKPNPNSGNKAICSQAFAIWRTATALVLCALLPGNLPLAQTPSTAVEPHPVPTPAKLDPNQRILHLLNRFTFGPTPDEIAHLNTLATQHPHDRDRNKAIDEWFEQQLDPDSLPATRGDTQLADRLAEYPAMTLPVAQLIESFPSGNEIRQTANGKLPMPDDPTLSAIYLRHINLYEEKQSKKAEAKRTASSAQPAIAPSAIPAPAAMASESTSKPETSTPDNQTGKQPTPKVDPHRPTYADLVVKTILALPPDQRVNRILKMQLGEYEQLRASLKGPQKLQLTDDMTPGQRELIADYDNPTRAIIEELESQRLLRDVLSSHQLQEVMTTFWLNHFNIYLHKNEETPYYLVSYERDVIAPRALGNFEDLLDATAESPAMMIYLDNSSSTGPDSPAAEKQKQRAASGKPSKATPPGLNENYARELMELHTLGVNGGYTQKDVTEVARVFTGWTVEKPAQGGNFKFDPTRHDPGKKVVMGKTIKENGQKEGFELLHMLATSPATAHFIARELAISFVSDNPPATLVNRMAQSFLKSKGDVPSVLRTMLHSPEFWAPAAYQAKVKTPLEYVVSAVRTSGATITNPQPLVQALNQMGMPLYACVPPTGYGAKADDWVSTGALVTRMNFGLSLGTNHYPGVQTDWALNPAIGNPSFPKLLSPMAGTQLPSSSIAPSENPFDREQRLEARLIPTGISDNTRTAVLNDAQDPAKTLANLPAPIAMPPSAVQKAAADKAKAAQTKTIQQQDALLAGLLLGSPEFQRR